MAAAVRDSLFGETLVRAGLCTAPQVEECLGLQEKLRAAGKSGARLGEILVARKYVTRERIDALLRGDYARQEGRFGEVAVRLSLCFSEGVQKALGRQSRLNGEGQPHRRLGELLVEDGALEKHHVAAVLEAMGLREVACASCRAEVNVPRDADAPKCPACGKSVDGDAEEPAEPLPEAPEAQPEDVSRIAKAMAPAQPQAAPPPAAPAPAAPAAKAVPVQAPAPSPAPAVQEKAAQFGAYEILAKLGANATGGLYLARKGADGPLVTLKIFSGELSKASEFARNFKAAAREGVGLKHPTINRVVDVGRDRGRVFCASEYVKGRSLRYLLETQGRFKVPLALGVAKQLAVALEYAHSRGVVHGDLKPSNVIVGADAAVKVANFGIVTNPLHNLLAVSRLSGAAPIYAAPELAAKGASPTAASDIYSLGATIYHMITGKPPVAASSPLQALARLAEEPIKPPSAVLPGLPPSLDKLVSSMIALEPSERPASMREVIQDLTALGAGEMPAARTAEPAAPSAPEADAAPAPADPASAEARQRAVLGAVVVVAVAAFFLAVALVLFLTAPPLPPVAEVRPLPSAAPDAPILKPPPARTPTRPPDGPRRPIGG